MNPNLCRHCEKPDYLCVCSELTQVSTRTEVLILQHPQEPDKLLGSATIAHRALPHSKLRVGLSYRNLNAAVGHECDPKRWMVLYLGNAKLERGDGSARPQAPLFLVDKKGMPLPDSESQLRQIRGLVVLDGTWSQAKTLWWRNPWLLKLRRGVLDPRQPSLYRKLRREPRRECLSTIESIALALSYLERKDEISESLLLPFQKLLELSRSVARQSSAG